MYDLIIVKKNKNINKILIVLFIVFVVLIIFMAIGIKTINMANNKRYMQVAKMVDINMQLEILKEKSHKEEEKSKLELTDNQINNINNIYSIKEKTAFLTFDDGPSKSVTPLILDVLKKENIKATFFVLGSNVEINSDILNRAYLEGHYIANHGYSHVYSSIYESSETVLNEYNKTELCIKKALNNLDFNSGLFRFPGRICRRKI